MLSGELRVVNGEPEKAGSACCFDSLANHHAPLIVAADFEDREKRLLWYLDLAELLHSLFAFALFLQQLSLARDVAAIALGGDILPHSRDCFASDDARTDRRQQRNLELMLRDFAFEPFHKPSSPLV